MKTTDLVSTLGLHTTLIEPEINNEASNYLMNNYNNLLKTVWALGIRDKAKDLLQDVCVSLLSDEEEGEGYKMSYASGKSTDDGCILVEQFVVSRIKGYAKNSKYSNERMEQKTDYRLHEERIRTEKIGKDGRVELDENGKVKYETKVVTSKVQVTVGSYAASYTESDDIDADNDGFQKAYAVACDNDSTEMVDNMLSIKENIDTCIDICDMCNINIVNIFKNIDELASMLGPFSKKKRSCDDIFSKITNAVAYHSDLAEALQNVLLFSKNNKAEFKRLIYSY